VFQNRGPSTAKLLSPSRVFVQGTIQVLTSAMATGVAYQLTVISQIIVHAPAPQICSFLPQTVPGYVPE